MQIGVHLGFQNLHGMSDMEFFRKETQIAIEATNRLFELAGTRSVLAANGLDRHWRNARVHTLHDPVRWKYHAIGNFALNGVNPPRHGAI